MLPQLVYLSSYHQPTFITFVTPNPAYLQTACEIWSFEPYHSTPAQPPPSYLQEQLPFTQPTGYLTNRMHNLDSFLAPSTDVLHSNQSLPTCATTIPTAVPHRAMDPSHQLLAHAANYSTPPLIPQPTTVAPQMPPHNRLYMTEFPPQLIHPTNFWRTANAVQQCFGTPVRRQCFDSQHAPRKLLIYRPKTAPQHR